MSEHQACKVTENKLPFWLWLYAALRSPKYSFDIGDAASPQPGGASTGSSCGSRTTTTLSYSPTTPLPSMQSTASSSKVKGDLDSRSLSLPESLEICTFQTPSQSISPLYMCGTESDKNILLSMLPVSCRICLMVSPKKGTWLFGLSFWGRASSILNTAIESDRVSGQHASWIS